MTEPTTDGRDPPFRDQAVAWAGGRRLGDVTRVDSATNSMLFGLLSVALAGLLFAGFLVKVPVKAEGTVVVDPNRGLVTALFDGPLHVPSGGVLTVFVGKSTRARTVPIDSVTSTGDHEVTVTGRVSPRDGPSRAGRAYIQTGSTSLLSYVLGFS